jgi:uncharacterized protein YuzE
LKIGGHGETAGESFAIKITYDAEADALSIVFAETTVTTQYLAEGIAADYDAAGRLVDLEILDVRRRVGDADTLRRIILEGVGFIGTEQATNTPSA